MSAESSEEKKIEEQMQILAANVSFAYKSVVVLILVVLAVLACFLVYVTRENLVMRADIKRYEAELQQASTMYAFTDRLVADLVRLGEKDPQAKKLLMKYNDIIRAAALGASARREVESGNGSNPQSSTSWVAPQPKGGNGGTSSGLTPPK